MKIDLPPREEFYKAVNDAIHELEEILELYNPLEIIGSISKRIAIFNLQDHAKSEDILWYPLIEYLMSLALSKPMTIQPKKSDKATIKAVLDNWKRLKSNFTSYFGSEYVDREDKTEAGIRFKLILDYFSVRGKSFSSHSEKTLLDIFKPHASHLIDTLGFSAEDFNDFISFTESEITSSLQSELDTLGALKELSQHFYEWSKDRDVTKETPEDVMKQFLEENPGFQSQYKQANQLSNIEAYNGFEIRPLSDVHAKILKAVSCSFGDNTIFLEPEKWRGWPTNDTIVSERPIIRVGGEFYLLSYATLAWNRVEIMESLLERYSFDYYQDRYLPSRSRYVEETTFTLFQTLLPNSSIHTNLYYYVQEDGLTKRVELDGLVLYDDCLLLYEAKAGMVPLPAKRGAMKGLKSKVSEILKDGHNQTIRALDYIQSSPKVEFFDEKDVLQASVERDRFQYQYLILVTLEPLFVLTTHLSSAKKLGLISGEKWPWAVFINDLRVIADIINHPTVFLHYLNRRIELNDYPAVETFDELDYFMYYLHTGLYFLQDELEQHESIMIVPSTIELDEYYNTLSKNGVSKTKPSVKLDQLFELIISRLEREMPDHFTSTCFHLLNCDDETRSEISKQIKRCEQRFDKEREIKSVAFRINGTGLLLGCVDNGQHDILAKKWATKWLNEMDVAYVTVMLWTPPIESGAISLFKFQKWNS